MLKSLAIVTLLLLTGPLSLAEVKIDFAKMQSLTDADISNTAAKCNELRDSRIGLFRIAEAAAGAVSSYYGFKISKKSVNSSGPGNQDDLLSITALPFLSMGFIALADAGGNLYEYFTPMTTLDLLRDIKIAQSMPVGSTEMKAFLADSVPINDFVEAAVEDEVGPQTMLIAFVERAKENKLCLVGDDAHEEYSHIEEELREAAERIAKQAADKARHEVLSD